MLDLSVIIVNYNTGTLLRQCLESLKEIPVKEIIIVDNYSVDESFTSIKEYCQLNNLILIQAGTNLGFSKANNLGIGKASSKYILLLNPDTIVIPGSLDNLLEFASKTHLGAVGPRLQYSDGRLQYSCGTRPSLLSNAFEALNLWRVSKRLFGKYRYMTWDHLSNRKVGWVSGAALLMLRSLYIEIGGLDPDFFMYGEDVDLCERLWQNGLPVYYYSGAYIIHLEGQSSRKARANTLLRGYQSKIYYFSKNHGRFAGKAALSTYILSSLVKGFIAGIAGLIHSKSEFRSIARAHLTAAVRLTLKELKGLTL